MINDIIKKLLTIKQNCKVLLNNKYICTFIDVMPFLKFEKNNNCPTYDSNTSIIIDDNKTGTLNVSLHLDLNYISITMSKYLNNKLISVLTITDIQFL